MAPARPGTFRAALTHREFRRLISAYLFSAIGQSFGAVALTVAVYELTDSASWVAAVAAARLLPYVIVPGLAGVVAGRVGRRRLLAISALARAALSVVLALAIAVDAPPVWFVVVTFVFTALGTPGYPAMAAAVPATLGAEDLAPGNGILTGVESLAYVVGPALGGLVLLRSTATVALVANAVIFLVAFGLAAILASVPPPTASPERARDELLAGARLLRTIPDLAAPIMMVVVVNLTYGGALVALVVYADDALNGNADFGVLNAALGVGAVLGILCTNWLARAAKPLLVLGVVTLLAGVPFALLGGVSTLVLAAALMVVAGAGSVATEVLAMTAVQRVVTRERAAHVFGLLDSMIFAALFAGSMLAPVLVAVWDAQVALALLGAVIPIGALLMSARFARAARRRVDADITARVTLLRAVPWLRGAPESAIEALAAESTRETIEAGARVIDEGADPDDFFVLEAGSLDVHRQVEGREALVASLTAGAGFGEIGLLERVPRTASVVATEASIVLRVRGDRFVATVNAVPSTAASALGGGFLGRLGAD